jgi:NitT/TauT family transport system permease protein
MLPGIGSYIALAIKTSNVHAIYCAILAMALVILLYDQILFRPLVAWSDKFRYEMTAKQDSPSSWLYTLFSKSRLAQKLFAPLHHLLKWIAGLPLLPRRTASQQEFFTASQARLFDVMWYIALVMLAVVGLYHVVAFLLTGVSWAEVGQVALYAYWTLLRVIILIILASIIWVPVGVLIGLNPRTARVVQPLAQFLAAFPANLFFPLVVIAISRYGLNPDIWLSPLMILGTQWYILFNVVAGAAAFPNDLREVSRNLGIKGWLWWWRVILPGIFPYYLTGAIGAYGGAWNASIVAELVSWGDKTYVASGLGAYIAQMTQKGDLVHVALGIGVMAIVVVTFNKFFWRPLYDMAERKLRFD